MNTHVLGEQPMGADDHVDFPARQPGEHRLLLLGVRKRESTSIFTGKSASRSMKVRPCCSARMVVGTSTATCLPPCTALNAARTAISVLP